MSVAPFPVPTPEEESVLLRLIDDWPSRTPLQRAIGLCVLRGAKTTEEVAQGLAMPVEEVRAALRGLWGVLWDQGRDHLYLK